MLEAWVYNKPEYDYTVGPMLVRYSRVEKDIGVEVDDRLTFTKHIDTIVKKKQIVKRDGYEDLSNFLHQKCLGHCYANTVGRRSQLEHASSVWNPYRIGAVQKVRNADRHGGYTEMCDNA